ncbi:hypothetical protein ACFQ4K_15395 [Tistrella bauzanensis]
MSMPPDIPATAAAFLDLWERQASAMVTDINLVKAIDAAAAAARTGATRSADPSRTSPADEPSRQHDGRPASPVAGKARKPRRQAQARGRDTGRPDPTGGGDAPAAPGAAADALSSGDDQRLVDELRRGLADAARRLAALGAAPGGAGSPSDPGDAGLEPAIIGGYVAAEAKRRLEALLAGVARYRDHPMSATCPIHR